MPAAVSFKTKPELAVEMLEQAWAQGVPMAWVTGDEVYGDAPFDGPGVAAAAGRSATAGLARQILADEELADVLARAKALLKTGFNAGSGYREVWIRDFATFIELSCEVADREEIRDNLRMFIRLQGEDGNIVDDFVHRSQANVGYDYIKKPGVPDYWGHKNTVETDQESSLVQAVRTYVRATGDGGFLKETVDGATVLVRLERALDYLVQHRFAAEQGLLWGATTVDWGDVQPEHEWGVVLDGSSHRAIDVYDNAMFLIALSDFWVFQNKKGENLISPCVKIFSSLLRSCWNQPR